MRGFIFCLAAMVGAWAQAAILPAHPALHAALNDHLRQRHGGQNFKATPANEYRAHLEDLNGDRSLDALVLMLGRNWGGTGGQTMFIFKGVERGFKVVSRMTCVSLPAQGAICLMHDRNKGWRDLAIRVSGGGAKAKFVRMRFDGARYPLNPTVRPHMADWPEGDWVLASGDATRKALTAGHTHFAGVLGKTTRFQMGLDHQQGHVSGQYFYEKYGQWIPLNGKASGTTVHLEEKSKNKVTATLVLTHYTTGWAGEWRSVDGRKRFPIRLKQVTTEHVHLEKGLFESSVKAAYPVFHGEAGVRFNTAIKGVFLSQFREVSESFEESLAEVEEELKTNPNAGGASYRRWVNEDTASVRYYSPDLVSVQGLHYEYTGGAHGNYGSFPVNYWWHRGQTRKVKLDDCFDPRKKWHAVVGGFIRRDLKKQGASWPPKTDEAAVDTAFFFSPAGIEFDFAPYHVGSYAEGMYTVLVPYAVLRPVLRADGPLARWTK